jgi:Holliday junction resolvase
MNARVRPINSREKGAAAEREFARLMFDHLGVSLVRNLEQSRRGGHDLTAPGADPVSLALDAYTIECKRYRAITPAMLAGFWRQAEAQAAQIDKVPALAYREDRREWRVVVPLSLLCGAFQVGWIGREWTAEISVPAFCCLIREEAGGADHHGGQTHA